jgi:hypothetical protein
MNGRTRATSVEEAEPVLRLREVRRLEDGELGIDLGDPVASSKPASTSCALTVSMSTARFNETVLPVTSTVSVPSPVRTADDLGVRLTVRGDPGIGELRGLDDAR